MNCRPANAPLRLLIAGVSAPLETFLVRLIKGLSDAGVEVTLGCARRPDPRALGVERLGWLPMPSWDGPVALRLARLGGMAARATLQGRADARVFAPFARNAGRARNRLETWYRLLPFAGRRWDVINFPWNATAATYLATFQLGVPIVVSCRGSQLQVSPHHPQNALLREALRATFEQAAAVHCVARSLQRAAEQFGLDPAKARIIPPAVDPAFFCPPAQPRRAAGLFRVIGSGDLVWGKGWEYAVEALARLTARGVKAQLEIIGNGPDRQRLLYTIDDLNLTGTVRLAGALPPGEIRHRLQHADAFLLASLSEGISNAALEAMACGLPVVVTDCGGMREAVTDGGEGFVTPVRDSAALAEALHTLATQPARHAAMSAAARARVLKDFTLDRQIGQWLALLRAVTRREPAAVAA